MLDASFEIDMRAARNALEAASEPLADAHAALRSMGRYDLARDLVDLLMGVRRTLAAVEKIAQPAGHDPADWYQR